MNKITIKKSEFKKLFDLAYAAWKPKLEEKLKEFFFDTNVSFTQEFFDQMKKACTAEQLVVFKKIFAKYLKKEVDIFKVTTYKEVCEKLGESEIHDYNFSLIDAKKICAAARIKQLERFFNGTWKANWEDSSQRKYYPYFQYSSGGGFRFFSSGSSSYYSGGQVGFYKDEESSNHVGKYFKEIYKNLN
jgi:hypothetical protein